MGQEKREFFRFDVEVPHYLENQDKGGHCLHVHQNDLITDSEYKKIQTERRKLNELFQDQRHIDNGAVALFSGLNKKLDFMVWLLEAVMTAHDVRLDSEYLQKKDLNQQIGMPELASSSKVFPLLQAYFQRVEEYIAELIEVIESSVQGKVFMYHKKMPKPFKVEHYMQGLPVAAKQGNWIANVIVLICQQLNHYEQLFGNLKQAYRELSDTESWPLNKINLAAGGFAFYSEDSFSVGQKFCCLFKLDDEFVFAKASCVYQSEAGKAHKPKRTAFQFDEINSEDSAHIVRYLMSKELELRNTHP